MLLCTEFSFPLFFCFSHPCSSSLETVWCNKMENTGGYRAPWHPGESTSKRRSSGRMSCWSYLDVAVDEFGRHIFRKSFETLELWFVTGAVAPLPWHRECWALSHVCALSQYSVLLTHQKWASACPKSVCWLLCCLHGNKREEIKRFFFFLPSPVEEVILSPHSCGLIAFFQVCFNGSNKKNPIRLQQELCWALWCQEIGGYP